MASYNWQVFKQVLGVGWVEVSDVQSISFSYGQRQLTDTWSPPVWIISGRRPDLLGTINIGDNFSVVNDGTPAYQYQVTNYEIHYGITSSMDTWTLHIEGPFSALARSVVSATWSGGVGSDSADAGRAVVAAAGLSLRSPAFPAVPTGGSISAQSVTNENGFDVFTRIARTSGNYAGSTDQFAYAKCWAYNATTIYWMSGATPVSYDWVFSDLAVAPDPTFAVYDQLAFGSLNLNYANKVVVTPVGGSPQTVGTGNSAFETTTYSATNNDALTVANRYAGLLSASSKVPTSISFTKEQQSSTAVLPDQIAFLNGSRYLRLIFRGADYYATVIGQDLSATPESTRITLYLCASENGNFFTLDSASLGVLDQNRLGI